MDPKEGVGGGVDGFPLCPVAMAIGNSKSKTSTVSMETTKHEILLVGESIQMVHDAYQKLQWVGFMTKRIF